MAKRTIPRDVHAEHRAIFDATLARNTELACQLTMDHIERTLTVLRSSLEPQGVLKAR
jgi:DNA-binding GntR family transcriptional regulator